MLAFLKRPTTPRAAAVILVLTLLASVVMGRETPAPAVVALSAPAAVPQTGESLSDLDIQRLGRSRNTEGVPDLFGPQRSNIPAPAPEIATPETPRPPAPPSAPPLPYTYLGQFIDGERTEVFVAHGDEHYTVQKGETLDGKYRIEKITPQAITFVYLPLGIRQQLAIPALK